MKGLEKMECEVMNLIRNLHQAISYEEHSDVESGKIIEVIQSGLKLGDRCDPPRVGPRSSIGDKMGKFLVLI
jgi:hypothetical protein